MSTEQRQAYNAKVWVVIAVVVLIVGWMIGQGISDDCMRIRGLM